MTTPKRSLSPDDAAERQAPAAKKARTVAYVVVALDFVDDHESRGRPWASVDSVTLHKTRREADDFADTLTLAKVREHVENYGPDDEEYADYFDAHGDLDDAKVEADFDALKEEAKCGEIVSERFDIQVHEVSG